MPAPAQSAHPLTFDELVPGLGVDSPTVAIDQGMVDDFARLTGDDNPLHLDGEHAARTPFRKRIAHGALVQSLAAGLAWRTGWFTGTIIAIERTAARYLKPVAPPEELTLRLEVVDRDAEPHPRRGRVELRLDLRDRRGETVLVGEWTVLMRRAEG
ncbi:MAG: MaoC family dehydratase [Planctomycetia bacterium]|jgi:3-hydroxybutyryl-CoA dehydratase